MFLFPQLHKTMAPKFDRYTLLSKLGNGSYGSVYEALDPQTNTKVAIKLEESKNSLKNEVNAYVLLHKWCSPTGIPKIFRYGLHQQSNREFLVMEKLGKSVRHHWNGCGKKFSLKTVVMLGTQMITRLESIHNRGIVHGDLKDDNFVMGPDNSETVYLLDFGLSRSFVVEGRHIIGGHDEHAMGTVYYASINTHNKQFISRRDDVESLAYMLIRFLKGRLPWEGWLGRYEECFERAGRKKVSSGVDVVCQGLPKELMSFLLYARQLQFQECPDYHYLRELLRLSMAKRNLRNDGVYDWMKSDFVAVAV